MVLSLSMPHREVEASRKKGHHIWRVMIIGGAICTQLLQQVGKQYKVAEGDIIKVEKLGAEAGETVTFDNVLAVSNDGLKVGADVANASVTASLWNMEKQKKLSSTSLKEKLGITTRTVTDSSSQK